MTVTENKLATLIVLKFMIFLGSTEKKKENASTRKVLGSLSLIILHGIIRFPEMNLLMFLQPKLTQ